MPKISYAKLTLSWDILTKSLADAVPEPLIETRRSELAAALVEVRERQFRQDVLLGQAAANTKLLHEAVERGKEAESRLRAFLKGTYGSKSAQLIRFGLRPQRKRRRAAKGAPDGAEPVEAEAVAAPAAAPAAEHPPETPVPSPDAAPATARRKPSAGTRRPQKRSPAKKAKSAKSPRRQKTP